MQPMTPPSVSRQPAETLPPRIVSLPSPRRAAALVSRAGSWLAAWVDRHAVLTVLTAYSASLVASLYLSAYLFWASIFPDEGQYAVVGENLIRYGVFQYRGDFPLLIPPGYTLVVALSRLLALGTTSIVPIFLLNHILMVGVVFPAYGLARQLNLPTYVAVLIGVSAAWIPDMWFVNHYMAEALYYPVFTLTCYVGARYFLHPSLWSATLTGGVLGAGLLTKNTALALVLAFGAASAWGLGEAILRRRYAGGRDNLLAFVQRYILWPGLAFASAMAVYAPWLLLRQRALGGCVSCGGEAGTISRASLRLGVLIHLVTLYTSDIFLNVNALALIPVVVACVVLLMSTPARQSLSVYLASAIVIVTGMAAIYSGDLASNGALVDRHLFVLFPVILALAARGIVEVRMVPRLVLIGASLLTSAALVYWLYQYDFYVDPLYASSWIYGFATAVATMMRNASWTRSVLFIGLGGLAVLAQGIWLLGHRRRVPVFVTTVLVVNAVSMCTVFGTLTWLGPARLTPYNGPGALTQWITKRVPEQDMLLVMGARSAAQPVVPTLAPDLQLMGIQNGFGDGGAALGYLEATGFYDIRMVPQLALLPELQRETHARYLLSPIEISGLHAIGQWGQDVLYNLDGTNLVGMVPTKIHYETAPDFYREDLSALLVPTTVTVNGTYFGSIHVRNGSTSSTWMASGDQTVGVSYHWWNLTGTPASYYYGYLAPLPSNLGPGQAVTMRFQFLAPSQPGDYLLEVDLTQLRNGAAFANQGGVPVTTLVHVRA